MPAFFISGSLGSKSHRSRIFARTTHRLLSLHGSYLKVAQQFVNTIEADADPRNIELMFDSGAFTAWSKGEPELDVRQLLKIYRSALKRCENMKFKGVYFINLDKIPGSPGRTATSEEMREALRISDENYRVLSAELGNRVLPVFHQSEPVSRLRDTAAMNPTYVCVSPRNDLGERERRSWSQRAHLVLAETATPSHGLAATGGDMMTQVPWRSVDSATWIWVALNGSIMFLHEDTWKSIAVSEHAGDRRYFGRHVDHGDRNVVAAIHEQCDELGITVSELRTELGARELINVCTLQRVSTRMHKPVPVQSTLFGI